MFSLWRSRSLRAVTNRQKSGENPCRWPRTGRAYRAGSQRKCRPSGSIKVGQSRRHRQAGRADIQAARPEADSPGLKGQSPLVSMDTDGRYYGSPARCLVASDGIALAAENSDCRGPGRGAGSGYCRRRRPNVAGRLLPPSPLLLSNGRTPVAISKPLSVLTLPGPKGPAAFPTLPGKRPATCVKCCPIDIPPVWAFPVGPRHTSRDDNPRPRTFSPGHPRTVSGEMNIVFFEVLRID